MANTTIKIPGLPSGLTLTVDVTNPTTAAVLETVTMTHASGVYSGTVTGNHAGLFVFILKSSGTRFGAEVRTIADDTGTYVILSQLETVYVEPTGARTITFTVTDDAGTPQALNNATIRLTAPGINRARTTDSNGQRSFALDDATYAVAITMAGHDDYTGSLVVTADATPTIQLSPSAGSSTPAVGFSEGSAIVYDEFGVAEANKPVSFKLIKGPGTAGRILDQKPFTLTSADGTGGTTAGEIRSSVFIQGATYEVWRGAITTATTSGDKALAQRSSASNSQMLVPLTSSFSIQETLGIDE